MIKILHPKKKVLVQTIVVVVQLINRCTNKNKMFVQNLIPNYAPPYHWGSRFEQTGVYTH